MTLVEHTEPVTLSDSSPERMTQLRDLMAGKEPEPQTEETQEADTAAAEPEGQKSEEKTEEKEPEKVSQETKSEPETKEEEEEKEEELPKGVQKRIEKEVARQAKLDRLIDEARSKTKAKEAELAKLTEKSGTEPAKPDSATDGEPVFPDLNTFQGSYEEFTQALAKAQKEWVEWSNKQTRFTVQQEMQRQRQEETARAQWDAAVKEHGEDFPDKVESVRSVAPEEMQRAIGLLDSWDKLVVHLADNPSELKALSQEYGSNPARVVAKLGRIEERLSAQPKPDPEPPVKQAVPEKEPPPPLKKAPAPSAAAGEFDWNKATPAQKHAFLTKNGALSGPR